MTINIMTRPALRTRRRIDTDTSPWLRATLVFHPDHTRIGAWVNVAPWPASGAKKASTCAFGRNEPIFSDGLPINEPYVSRRALDIQLAASVAPQAAHVRLIASAQSAVSLGIEEVDDLVVSESMARRGVAVRLGHGVVVLLRLVDSLSEAHATAEPIENFYGASAESHGLQRQLAYAARSSLPVLVLGESGVGKEVAARAVHALSPRAHRPMVSVNMGAIPESLAAAELFGSTRGAFTGAEARRGYFHEADGGTLFLDEVAATPATVQAQLLRALEQGEVQMLGGKRSRVDTRIVAATDGSVRREEGFNPALFNRLSAVSISIPPLRARLEDIGPQGMAFLRAVDQEHPLYPLHAAATEPSVAAHWGRVFFDALNHDWPGNSRELRQVFTRHAQADPNLDTQAERSPGAWAVSELSATNAAEPDDEQLIRAYRDCDFEVMAAARQLGLSRTTMYRRLEAHPDCRLIADYSDADIRDALASEASLVDVARALGVSRHALSSRLKHMSID